jgi:hypothetical protein
MGTFGKRLQVTTADTTDGSPTGLWRVNNPFIRFLTSFEDIVKALCLDDEEEDRDDTDVDNWKIKKFLFFNRNEKNFFLHR